MLNNSNKICAVIVTYNPNVLNLNNLINATLDQCEHVIVIDNGSEAKLTNLPNKVITLPLENNLGIAAAQNFGIKKGADLGAEYFVFFDQDSVIDTDTIYSLKESYDLLTARKKVAAVGPVYKDEKKGFTYPVIRLNRAGCRERIIPKDGGDELEVSFIISSGMFVSAGVIESVGLMMEELFIDYVDTEWCLRATALGYKFYVVPRIKMIHSIGDKTIKLHKWNLPVHSPFRRFYRLRNVYYLIRLPHVPLALKGREFITNTLHQLLIILYSGDRRAQLKAYFKANQKGIKSLFGGRNE